MVARFSNDAELTDFIEADRDRRLSLLVVNLEQPSAVRRMIDGAFASLPLDVAALDDEERGRNRLVLVDGEEVVAETPLDDLLDSFLLVNSDTYKTARDQLGSLRLPAVLTELDETVFTVRGYPEADKEKLLLILLSRHVEQLAWRTGGGRLRSGFQYLSRLDDERGTAEVYRRLGDSTVETHVYGVPDRPDAVPDGVVGHGGDAADYRDSWFVVFRPGDDASVEVDDGTAADAVGSAGHAALVATRTDARRWRGVWTYDPERVVAVDEFLREQL